MNGNIDQTDAGGAGDYHPPQQAVYHVIKKAPTAVLTKEDFESEYYKMSYKNRGQAVIINNWHFDEKLKLPDRPGSNNDCNKMTELLQSMGFDVNVYANCSVKMMQNVMGVVSEMDHRENDCFVCVVLSHGDEGIFYGTDDTITMDNFILPIKGKQCPSLAFKPKIFLVQACKYTPANFESETEGQEAEDEVVSPRRIPNEADLLMMYSVLPVNKASWFIEAVYKEFTKVSLDGGPAWKTLDILTLMTRVNRRLSIELETKAPTFFCNIKQQLPCITSLLTKEVQFC